MEDYYAIITQNGYSLEATDINLPHQFSGNIPIKIIKDNEKFKNYILLPFFVHSAYQYIDVIRANEGVLIEYDEETQIATLPYSAFNKKGYLFISTAMREIDSNKTIYTGTVMFKINESINGEQTIPSETIWIDAIIQFVDNYMDTKYKPNYDRLLQQAEDLQKQAQSLQDEADSIHKTVSEQQTKIEEAVQTTTELQKSVTELKKETEQNISDTKELQINVSAALDKAKQQQAQIDSSITSMEQQITNSKNELIEDINDVIDIMGDYEIVQEDPTKIRFKKGDGTFGDTVNLGDNLASKNMVYAGYETYIGNNYSGLSGKNGIEFAKAKGNYTQETTNGYQLFDVSKIPTNSQGGVTLKNNGDGSYTISGSGVTTAAVSMFYNYDGEWALKHIKAGNITLKTIVGDKSIVLQIYFNIIEKSTQKSVFTVYANDTKEILEKYLDSEKYLYRIGFWCASGVKIVGGTIKPMLYQDGDGTWESFTGGMPSPNPEYPQEPKFFDIDNVYSVGKNLFDFTFLKNNSCENGNKTYNDSSITLVSTKNDCYDQSYINSIFRLKVQPNKKYTLLFKRNASILGTTYVFEYNENNTLLLPYQNKASSLLEESFTFTTKSNCKTIAFRVGIANTGKTCTFNGFMILQGEWTWDSIKEFIPYKNIITTPLSLILRSLPNGVKDTYENGVITRRVGVIEFDGSSDEGWIKESNFYITISNKAEGTMDGYVSNLVCNKLRTVARNTIIKSSDYYIREATSLNKNIIIRITDEIDTVDKCKTWLQSNPITVWYELATPTTEEITLPIIPSYYPYTNVWHDSEVQGNELIWHIKCGDSEIVQSISEEELSGLEPL